MADVQTFCRFVGESARDYNTRVLKYCQRNPVTNFELHVVDGMPMLVLMMEEVQATADDVAKALALWEQDLEEARREKQPLPDKPELEVGEWIPAADPLIVQVSRVSCLTKDEAGKSEERLGIVYAKAEGNVMRHITSHGKTISWVEDPNVAAQIAKVRAQNAKLPAESRTVEPEMKYVQQEVSASYCAVGYLNPNELEDDEDDDGDEGGEGGDAPAPEGSRRRAPATANT